MKIKKTHWVSILILALVLLFFIVFRIGGEDSWIRDEKGIWIKHGNPSKIPSYVQEQQRAIECASQLYQERVSQGIVFSSQCLGSCGNYAIDIVHIPRAQEDNLAENQCEDYNTGKVSKFIELDKMGNIVMVVD